VSASNWKASFGADSPVNRTLRCGEIRVTADNRRAIGQPYDEHQIIVDLNAIVTGIDSCIDYIEEKANVDKIATAIDDNARPRLALVEEKYNNILVLLHGYDNNFPDTITRAVAFAQDIKFDGLLLVWCWPSAGWKSLYEHDVAANAFSSENFSDFFQKMTSKAPSMQIDYIAHSMGGRILLQYLFDNRKPVRSYPTFAAPDIDADNFRTQLQLRATNVPLSTLYASAYDRALKMSKIYNVSPSPRAGTGGIGIIVLPQMDSIDVNLGGHSYVFEHPYLLQDFEKLEREHIQAALRGLTPRNRGQDTYYVINP
jgi:esterase/lipase superfamily enzyme